MLDLSYVKIFYFDFWPTFYAIYPYVRRRAVRPLVCAYWVSSSRLCVGSWTIVMGHFGILGGFLEVLPFPHLHPAMRHTMSFHILIHLFCHPLRVAQAA